LPDSEFAADQQDAHRAADAATWGEPTETHVDIFDAQIAQTLCVELDRLIDLILWLAAVAGYCSQNPIVRLKSLSPPPPSIGSVHSAK
jgi:hypothetical protein